MKWSVRWGSRGWDRFARHRELSPVKVGMFSNGVKSVLLQTAREEAYGFPFSAPRFSM